ncbi:MAG: GntR family transcriptional regulator [Gemmatimonadota bacterium]
MKGAVELAHNLRNQVVGANHTGQLHPGDRLPGLRRTARQFAVNPRTVASAYRDLAAEGLVEIRKRTGVFVAPQQLAGSGILEETTRWLSPLARKFGDVFFKPPAEEPAWLAAWTNPHA